MSSPLAALGHLPIAGKIAVIGVPGIGAAYLLYKHSSSPNSNPQVGTPAGSFREDTTTTINKTVINHRGGDHDRYPTHHGPKKRPVHRPPHKPPHNPPRPTHHPASHRWQAYNQQLGFIRAIEQAIAWEQKYRARYTGNSKFDKARTKQINARIAAQKRNLKYHQRLKHQAYLKAHSGK